MSHLTSISATRPEELHVTFPYIAEMVRSTTSQLYALALEQAESEIEVRLPSTRTILHSINKRLSGLPNGPEKEEITGVFFVLREIRDIAHFSSGRNFPRESRVVVYSEEHGRIAGGLPIHQSEHSDAGLGRVIPSTIGRVVELAGLSELTGSDWEESEFFRWSKMDFATKLTSLEGNLRSPINGCPSDCSYYHPLSRRERYRQFKWQTSVPDVPMTIARTESRPRSYFLVYCNDRKRIVEKHYDLTWSLATFWLATLDSMCGVKSGVDWTDLETGVEFKISGYIPRSCIEPLLAACHHFRRESWGWTISISKNLINFADNVLKASSLQRI